MAHRGASRAEPENTVAAYRRAGSMGAHAVELDVRRSLEGDLVVHHDPHLPDGRLIRGTPRAELPASVPSLGEALGACAGMWVNIEIKNDRKEPDFDSSESIADATIDVLRQRAEDERWLISSFRMETIDRCRSLAPTIATAWLTISVPRTVTDLLNAHGHVALHPWVGMVKPKLIERCHAAGIRVNTWTCDDPDRMRELIAAGIDGICTNVPDVALRVLAES
ncbi:MAG: glycerophosphodiester phosphodiesterase [Acidimicrobiia bacterium]